jgi:flagellar basal-body rod protein FlgG
MGVRALNIAAQLRNIDVIANNMANINTGGFRKDRLNFADLFYDTDALIGAKGPGGKIRPSGIELGNGVQILATQKLFSHGGYSKTDSELDLAISKDPGVFFRIRRPDGSVGFTRNGNFTKDEAGTMVTMDGGVLEPDIIIPAEAKQVTIARDGTVTANDGTTAEGTIVGQITLSRFVNPSGLKPAGDNLFQQSATSGPPGEVTPAEQGNGHLLQGYTDNSNVQVVKELISLIAAQRSYEINSNVIRTSDQAFQLANNLRG